MDCASNVIDCYIHRCECQIHLKPGVDRIPYDYLFHCRNPFTHHNLIHLGVVDDWTWLLFFIACRLIGFGTMKKELQKLCRTRSELQKLNRCLRMGIEHYTDLSSRVLPQPATVFERDRVQLNQSLNSLLGLPSHVESVLPTPIFRSVI
jgi:hypothetical protein